MGTLSYTYDALDRAASVTDGKGQPTTLSYDAMDRPVGLSYADGSFVSYAYDGNGNVVSSQDSSGTSTYTYDAFNRLTSETAPGAETITYGYDRDGMLVSYTDSGGTTRYGYGDGQKVRRVTEPNGSVTNYQTETAPGAERSFHPDFPVVTTYPNGVTVTQTPDIAGRLATMLAQGPYRNTLFNRTYDYQNPDTEGMSNLLQTEIDYVAYTSTRYVYDGLDRLVQVRTTDLSTGAPIKDFGYAYDAGGNRTSTTTSGSSVAETSNDANQITARGATSFGYDANGNLTSSTAGFSASYNAANQATSMRGASGTTVSASNTGVGQSQLSSLGGQAITNSGLGITRVGGDRFTRGPDGRLVSMRTAEGDTYYYLTDLRGTVIGMVGPGEVGGADPCMPDTGGGVGDGEPCAGTDPPALTVFGYDDPFGTAGPVYGNSPAAQRNPFRFTGALYSPDLGLYKMGERWYDPELGRWTQADPLLQPYSSREANRYGYAAADPVNLADPSGLISCGVAIGGTAVAATGTGAAVTGGITAASGGTLTVPAVAAGNFAGALVAAAGAGLVSNSCAKQQGVPPHTHPIPGGPAVANDPIESIPPLVPINVPPLKPIMELASFSTGGGSAHGSSSSGGGAGVIGVSSVGVSQGFMPGCA